SGLGPKYQAAFFSSVATGCFTNRAKAVRLNQLTRPLVETNSALRFFGSGKQSCSRQTPCGLTTNPVARLRSAIVIHKSLVGSGEAITWVVTPSYMTTRRA